MSASATKNIGMPLSRTSSTTGGISNLTVADRYTASSERSIFNWATSVASTAWPAHASAAHRQSVSTRRITGSGMAFFKNRVIKTVVITLQIVREDGLLNATLG